MSAPFNDQDMKRLFGDFSARLRHPGHRSNDVRIAKIAHARRADGAVVVPIASNAFKELVHLGYEVDGVELTRNSKMEI